MKIPLFLGSLQTGDTSQFNMCQWLWQNEEDLLSGIWNLLKAENSISDIFVHIEYTLKQHKSPQPPPPDCLDFKDWNKMLCVAIFFCKHQLLGCIRKFPTALSHIPLKVNRIILSLLPRLVQEPFGSPSAQELFPQQLPEPDCLPWLRPYAYILPKPCPLLVRWLPWDGCRYAPLPCWTAHCLGSSISFLSPFLQLAPV